MQLSKKYLAISIPLVIGVAIGFTINLSLFKEDNIDSDMFDLISRLNLNVGVLTYIENNEIEKAKERLDIDMRANLVLIGGFYNEDEKTNKNRISLPVKNMMKESILYSQQYMSSHSISYASDLEQQLLENTFSIVE